jgi:hypothetical protein
LVIRRRIIKGTLAPLATDFSIAQQFLDDVIVILQGKLPEILYEHLLAKIWPTPLTFCSTLPQDSLIQFS